MLNCNPYHGTNVQSEFWRRSGLFGLLKQIEEKIANKLFLYKSDDYNSMSSYQPEFWIYELWIDSPYRPQFVHFNLNFPPILMAHEFSTFMLSSHGEENEKNWTKSRLSLRQ